MAIFFDPEKQLIGLGRDDPGGTLTDALAGTLVTGAIGSGKTSGPGKILRNKFLKHTKKPKRPRSRRARRKSRFRRK